MLRRRTGSAAALLLLAALPVLANAAEEPAAPTPATFGQVKLLQAAGGSEPRVAVAPDGSRWSASATGG